MYNDYKHSLFKTLDSLRAENGTFRASLGKHYVNYTWWRDNFYCNLPYLDLRPKSYEQAYHTYLDFLTYYETVYKKFSSVIQLSKEGKHISDFMFLHPRVRLDGSEIHNQPWGFRQNDATGYMLIGVYLGTKNNLCIIRNDKDRHIIQLIIDYLIALRFWECPDSGAWEENVEVRSSSIGVCYQAMCYMKELGFNVPDSVIATSRLALYNLLPYETPTRFCDLSLLFLPFLNIVSGGIEQDILDNTHLMLEREFGIIRYVGDKYYNSNYANLIGNEAQWVFGFAYLSCIYSKRGDTIKAKYYLDRIVKTWADASPPELVYAKSNKCSPIPNDNKPLAWTCALTLLALAVL